MSNFEPRKSLPALSDERFTSVEHYAPETKAKAYNLFLHTNSDFTDIALDTGVRTEVLVEWARQGKWAARKRELELEVFSRYESKYRQFIADHKLPTIERHLRIAAELEEAIEIAAKRVKEAIVDDVDSKQLGKLTMELRRLSEALSSSTNVSARAAAITDRPDLGAIGQEASAKQPLVMLNLSPQVSREPEDVRDA